MGIVRAVPDDNHHVFLRELRAQGFGTDAAVRVVPQTGDEVVDVDAAADLIRSWTREGLDLVVALSTPLAQAAVEAAPATPVLFLVNDPVAGGLVRDVARPDGSATGVTFRTPADRTLAFASEVLGGLDRVGYLWPEGDTGVEGHRTGIVAAAEELGIRLVDGPYADPGELPAVVDRFVDQDVDAVVLATSTTTARLLPELEAALDAAKLPAVANTERATFAVVTLTPDAAELRRQLGRQAARILGGTRVADVPVEDPRRFQLIVNRTKATALGLGPIDPAILRQVDVVR